MLFFSVASMRQIPFSLKVQKNKLKLQNAVARGGTFNFSGNVIFQVCTLKETGSKYFFRI